tara:strand:- start:704 stop:1039 length:336 start_codon:yes stop_codon:yes gene_type:complete
VLLHQAARMEQFRQVGQPAEIRSLARSRRARRWAWMTSVSLGICALVAIWQERALAPGVHDALQGAVAQAQSMIEGNETARALLARLDGGIAVAKDAGLDPLTALLLRVAD